MSTRARKIIHDGIHAKEALSMLQNDIKDASSLVELTERAAEILGYAVDPVGGPQDPSYGLVYGLIQSGKTSVITLSSAMAADNGFKCLIILTSDINPLYRQTLKRMRSQLQGLTVFGKSDWNDHARFERQIRTSPFAVVCSKNTSHLENLLEAFKKVGSAGSRGLPTLIIDDEADQASLNTKTAKNGKNKTHDLSSINRLITKLREFFSINTYLQVTATPQALFLQRPDGLYRPSFTVLTRPGKGYTGGEVFFEDNSKLLENVELEEVDQLKSGHEPAPKLKIPNGLRRALLNFLIAATNQNLRFSGENFSFLCHVSHTKIDHQHIVTLIDKFREDLVNLLKNVGTTAHLKLRAELQAEYDNLAKTDSNLHSFDAIMAKMEFFLPAAIIKEINSDSDEEIVPDHVYSIFVGGNKLGRGVTIPNLISSYYGRNPKTPNADTVLQHARMYGYRQKHISVTRLFLPAKLAEHFRIIHQMEKSIRALVESHPQGKFEGIYISSPLKATRSNVLDANSIGVYVAGGWCNPRYVLRDAGAMTATKWLDGKLAAYDGSKDFYVVNVDFVMQLIGKCQHDPDEGAELWNTKIICTALEKLKTLGHRKAYLRVSHDRNINAARRETQGFYDGGEDKKVPMDAPTLFMFKLKQGVKGESVWLPQIRFPAGNYALSFSFIE